MRYIRCIYAIVFWLAISVLFGSSEVCANVHDFYDISAEEIRGIAETQMRQSGQEIDFLFRVYTIDRNLILRYLTGDDLSPMIQPTDEWLVFMRPSTLCLAVNFVKGEWQVRGFVNMQNFADEIKKNIPSEFMPGTDGNRCVLLYLILDFIAIPVGKETKLMPILDYHDYPYIANYFPPDKKDDRGLYSASDVMPHFVRSIKSQMAITPHLNVDGNWYLDGAYYPAEYSANIGQNITVAAELMNINGIDDDADWWVVAEHNGKFYYLDPSMEWVTARVPIAQSPVRQVRGFPIYSGTLPAGIWKLYVGLDLTQDGVINEPLFWNMVTITVRE